MPDKATVERAKKDLREGKSPSTAAGGFVREELEHIREGEHGARSSKQAIAIGLSKARRAGVPLEPPTKEQASARTRRSAKQDLEVGRQERKPRAPSKKRSKATQGALKREGRQAASKQALSAQAKSASRKRTATARKTSARKAAATRKASSRQRR
ncbi:transcription elongation factor [Corallococcus sp. AS-1-6]|uniref:transcription elongation factor n=1 Tax=Corallococcus sp. AS-1-6 TaxID=2874599 RepID=UPI001CBE2C5C|nr:transcription elongation factor [Corallococcus sp. AS-1-6]MBZ4376425.1 transcription elongation factor [Corallococcus sp. AS-1-6]